MGKAKMISSDKRVLTEKLLKVKSQPKKLNEKPKIMTLIFGKKLGKYLTGSKSY